MRYASQEGSHLTCSSEGICFNIEVSCQPQTALDKGLAHFLETWGRYPTGEQCSEELQVVWHIVTYGSQATIADLKSAWKPQLFFPKRIMNSVIMLPFEAVAQLAALWWLLVLAVWHAASWILCFSSVAIWLQLSYNNQHKLGYEIEWGREQNQKNCSCTKSCLDQPTTKYKQIKAWSSWSMSTWYVKKQQDRHQLSLQWEDISEMGCHTATIRRKPLSLVTTYFISSIRQGTESGLRLGF